VTPAAHVPRRGPERGAQRAEPAPRPAAAESGPFRPAARKSVSGAAVRKANKLNAQGFAKYRAGRPADALRFYLAAVRTNPNDPYYWYNAACIYSIRGEVSSALRHLEGFAQRLTPTQLARARVKIDIDSDLDRIRRDSRFLEFRRRLRL
jgi:tetratricopeptide (TPR) repeat protein